MTKTTLFAEVFSMSLEDRIQLAHAILDSLIADQNPGELTDSQKQELDRRMAELDANPANVLTWEQIKAHVLR